MLTITMAVIVIVGLADANAWFIVPEWCIYLPAFVLIIDWVYIVVNFLSVKRQQEKTTRRF